MDWKVHRRHAGDTTLLSIAVSFTAISYWERQSQVTAPAGDLAVFGNGTLLFLPLPIYHWIAVA